MKPKLTRPRFLEFLKMKGIRSSGRQPVSNRPIFSGSDTAVVTEREKAITVICTKTNRSWTYKTYEQARDRILKLVPEWQ